MNNYLIVLFSFLVSTYTSVWTFKKKGNKWISLIWALGVNVFILILATLLYYYLDDESRLFGFAHSDIYVLILAIPVVTWSNFFVLEFVRNRGRYK
ncbi:hypothetical protein [Bacillus sp. Marseille-P3661]|uniref:hypothetical protein n=1 Tax=Bacillus sp. Marseille-P3661 TaxID=1936234 RepID=UPI000C864D91|nr:hypothetical protein [Bacillus sp. Marseille-P3661]